MKECDVVNTVYEKVLFMEKNYKLDMGNKMSENVSFNLSLAYRPIYMMHTFIY